MFFFTPYSEKSLKSGVFAAIFFKSYDADHSVLWAGRSAFVFMEFSVLIAAPPCCAWVLTYIFRNSMDSPEWYHDRYEYVQAVETIVLNSPLLKYAAYNLL